MSTPAPPRPASGPSLSPTRQQLDDLEVLMRRMLALPVNQLEEDGPPASEVPELAAPSPPPRIESELDRILGDFPARSWPSPEEPAEEEEPPELSLFAPGPPAAPSAEQASVAIDLPETASATAEPELAVGEVSAVGPAAAAADFPHAEEQATDAAWTDPPPVRHPAPPPSPPKREPRAAPALAMGPPVPLVFYPVVWINDGFDACTVGLGPLGRWLRGPGRALLGLAGLLLLAAAVAWGVLDWMGWTW